MRIPGITNFAAANVRVAYMRVRKDALEGKYRDQRCNREVVTSGHCAARSFGLMAAATYEQHIIVRCLLSDDAIEQINQQAHAQIPMGRSGTADEIARAVLFLASDDAAYISGVELTVDGGWTQV